MAPMIGESENWNQGKEFGIPIVLVNAALVIALIVLVGACFCCEKRKNRREQEKMDDQVKMDGQVGVKREHSNSMEMSERETDVAKMAFIPKDPNAVEEKEEPKNQDEIKKPETSIVQIPTDVVVAAKPPSAASPTKTIPAARPVDAAKATTGYRIPTPEVLMKAKAERAKMGDGGCGPIVQAKTAETDKKSLAEPVPNPQTAEIPYGFSKIIPGKTLAPKINAREREKLDFVQGDTPQYASLAEIEDVFTASHLKKFKEEEYLLRALEKTTKMSESKDTKTFALTKSKLEKPAIAPAKQQPNGTVTQPKLQQKMAAPSKQQQPNGTVMAPKSEQQKTAAVVVVAKVATPPSSRTNSRFVVQLQSKAQSKRRSLESESGTGTGTMTAS